VKILQFVTNNKVYKHR